MSVDPTQLVIFDKSIVISNSGELQNNTGNKGQLRFNQSTLKFEGYHSAAGADIFGNVWRPLTQDVATTSNLGVFRVGNNLTINPSTGVLSSIASGSGRINQLVITVSPILGAADYQTINEAISNAIGTSSGGYIDGSITSVIGSPPSTIYPFVIQLAPGQYSESLNQIVLPDYVSMRGESNYNSIINQNAGNATITTGSMLVLGQNCDLRDLVVNLADSSSSAVSNAIYSLNKSNISIDSCIFTCNTNITTTSNTSSIYMNGGLTNSITNSQFLINSSSLTGIFTGITIINATPRIINNNIDILTPNATSTKGISLSNWNETESIMDKTYIENLTLSNNYKNTNASLANNIGISLNNSLLILKNSDIEVSNLSTLTNNYGIQFGSSTPLVETTSSNIVSFVNTPAVSNVINSSNSSIVNFVTLGFQQGQYISISGSSNNDSLYKIKSVTSATQIVLDTGFQVISESANISNTITIKALYNVDIQNSKINSSSIALENNDNNSNYLFNLNNLITLGDKQITPSFTFNTNYKTFTVGKVNCNFTSLTSAIDSITDNSSNTRYLIKIESGIYQEDSYITCKPYVNIEGNGTDNTTLLFYQSSNTNGTATANSSCLLLCSNTNLSGFTINNSSTGNEIGQRASTVLYNPSPITNLTLENIKIDSICNSYWNFGIYLVSAIDNIVFRNIYSNVYSNITANANTGIYNVLCSGVSYYNITSTVTSPFSTYNYAINIVNSDCNIYNSTLISTSGIIQNVGLNTNDTNTLQKLVQIYGGQIRVSDGIDYSIYADNYYTVVCNGVQLIGDTNTNSTSSRIFCSGCYTFNDINDKTNVQSLNNRGQNEQSLLTYSTLTIGDTAGKLDATGTDNVFIGVDSGSNVTTASNSTFIGSNTGRTTNIADRNTLIGAYVGQNITTGSRNTITGAYSAGSLTTGEWNTINGAMSALYLSSGTDNTIIGSNTAVMLTSGSENIFIGNGSGYTSNTASDNTMIGFNSGGLNETGNNNTYIGKSSGNNSVNGSNNVLIGNDSGYTNQSNGIVSVGTSAGYNNTNAIKNTYLGNNSGYNNITGDANTYIGNRAGYNSSSASGSFNTAIGNEAGYSITSGSRNVLVGSTTSTNGISNDSAGWSLTSGNDNIHIGVSAGNNATSAINNVFIGSSIGTAITTASNNILIGEKTANTLTTSGQNVIIGTNAGNVYTSGNGLMVGYNSGSGYTGAEAFAIGYQAGANITGDFNMFMGYNSGGLPKVNTTGAYNIAIGPYTGFNLSSGTRNTILGSGNSSGSAGKLISTGSDNTIIGYKAGSAIQTGVGNTLFGSNAGANLTSGLDNLVLGYQSGFNLNSGSYNVILGPQAGYSLNNGQGNIYSGYQSGYNNSTGSYNINMGYQSGYTSTGNNYNIHVGHKAGYKSEADNNLFLGYQSGLNNTFGTNNIFIGVEAGAGVNVNSEQIGVNNIFLGTHSGYSNDNGYSNIYMGAQAGESSIDGSKNIFIGENAGSSGTTSHNIFIGNASSNTAGIGYLSTGIGEYNVFVGSDVGIANTTGSKNIFLGDKAGRDNTTGVENIYIGTNAGQQANTYTANYNIAIGSDTGINNLSGTENILIGRQVAGLVTSTNYNQNIIIGTDAGQNIQQDNQIFIGTNTGQNNTTGDRNIFIGLNAGSTNIISNDNVIIGSNAGVSLIGNGSSIGDNVIIGSEAGHDLTTGTNNIYIGSGAGTNAVTSINNVVIGANAMTTGDANNVVIIGKNAGQSNSADANIFIGSNAGVQNTTGIGNIFVGHESGYAITTSNGNIVFGNETASSGRIADNNIIFGNQTAKNVSNKVDFANNIIMGSDAGKTSNLAISSIMIGTNTVGTGSGGDVNIIIGNNTAINLGNPNNYYAITLTQMTTNTNFITIDIPFGTGSYYFNYGDTIIIESLTNEYVFESEISSLLSDNSNIGNNGKTELVFNNKPIQIIPVGSVCYVKNVKQDAIGQTDYSKSSSNMCIGDHNGFELTTGSKNASIGDNAMYSNKVGRYNITLGTESGYNLNTDNNLCLGIKAGYSIDSYKDTSVVDDFAFDQLTNTITTTSQIFDNYIYGTVFDIEGSSSNDARYYVKGNIPKAVSGESHDQLVVQGFPNIIENGIKNTLANYIIEASSFSFINNTITNNITFGTTNPPHLGILKNTITLQSLGGSGATALLNIIKYASYATVTNSKFNNGIKLIDNETGIYISGGSIIIGILENIYITGTENANVSVSFNNISYPNSIDGNSFNTGVFSGDNLNAQIGLFNGVYKISSDSPYYLELGLPRIEIKGALSNQIQDSGLDTINQVYTNSITVSTSILSNYINNINQEGTTNKIILFDELKNIINLPLPNSYTGLVFQIGLIYITGTLYNNGYFYVYKIEFDINDSPILYIDINFPITQEIVSLNSVPNAVNFRYIEITNGTGFNDIYKTNSSFAGNILNIKYRTNPYQNYSFGSYVLECFYKDNVALNDRLLQYYDTSNLAIDISVCDNGFKTITNNYISSNDLIFQTSNVTLNNITFDSALFTITSLIDFEFINIVAPVIIKVSGTISNNNLFLVSENLRPFKSLKISGTLIDEIVVSGVNIQTNSISSYYKQINLSYLQFNNEYTIFGSKYNDEKRFTLYDNVNALSNVSVYLDNNSIIENENTNLILNDNLFLNDSYNDFYYSIVNNPSGNTGYSSACNKGIFLNFTITSILVSVINSTTLQFTDTLNVNIQSLDDDSYLTISNTPSGTYDGLYWISSITNISNVYDIVFHTKYYKGGIVYTTPDPFSGATFITCDILSNQFIFKSDNLIVQVGGNPAASLPVYNLDWVKVIDGFGTNAKYISFNARDGSIFFGSGVGRSSPLFGSISDNSLTFEIDSFKLNTSNIAVSFVETCPTISANSFFTNSYVINFGVPNPTTQVSNIYRKQKRPIMYSKSIIYINNTDNLITFNSSLNTISINPYSGANRITVNNIIYGKVYLQNTFSMLSAGQVFYINYAANTGYYLIESISDDYKTIYLDTVYNPLSSNDTLYNITINLQYSLNDSSLNFNEFNLGLFPSDYQMMIFKGPTSSGLLNDKSAFIDDTTLSELYFPINAITKTSNSTIAFDTTSFITSNIAPTKLIELCMNTTIITPSTNVINNYTNLSFHNLTITGSSDISFYSGNNTITSITSNLSLFLTSEYILVSGTSNNNYLYRIDDSIINAPTSNTIIISQDYALVDEANTSASIEANNINTSNITLTDLSVFGGAQVIICSRTNNNNNSYTSNINSHSSYSIFIDTPVIISELPKYCCIEKCIIIDETSSITGSSNINFSNSTITVSNSSTNLSKFRTGQTLAITGTSFNNTNITISESVIPSNISITTDQLLVSESYTNATLTKQIDFSIIGEPVQNIVNAEYSTIYHYEDAEGNNSMIGSFAGQYIGSLNNAIYNVAIGSRCAQVNHGSGNIFIGNESKMASNALENNTTYSNKFAIYKNNLIGIPINPLIGGDFTSGKVGINTITPESFSTNTDITLTDTKLVVNGGAIANSFSPFTGCHIVNLISSNVSTSTTNNSISIAINDLSNTIQVGMIVSSIGIIKKSSIISTYCSVKISSVSNDKTVFGVYSFKEQSKESTENEYIIDSNGKYVKNLSYNNTMVNLHYVASLGEGCILITNYKGEIQNGDYITTSVIAGYGALQSDDILHSYTVAKCTETIDWSSINNSSSIVYNGISYKTYLAGCTYHCG